MLIDDSIIARTIFSRILSENPRIKITYEADGCHSAINYLKDHQVDIILLDIEMPNRTGLDALPDIISLALGARIMIVSSFIEANGPIALRALKLGACDTLAKPGRTGYSGTFAKTLIEKVVRLATEDIQSEADVHRPIDATPSKRALKISDINCIAIGASTGGIAAIFEIIGGLKTNVRCPIFITQHLPVNFMNHFVRQLESLTDRTVLQAESGMAIEHGHIYVAPGDAHLQCQQHGKKIIIALAQDHPTSLYRPSVDAMLESLAVIHGKKMLSIVLSGMGNDGVIGARQLQTLGAPIIVQDRQSSVVWGMPGAIMREGLAQAALPAEQIASVINEAFAHE